MIVWTRMVRRLIVRSKTVWLFPTGQLPDGQPVGRRRDTVQMQLPHMQILHRRTEAGMSQQPTDRQQIDARFQQICRKTVTQRMRCAGSPGGRWRGPTILRAIMKAPSPLNRQRPTGADEIQTSGSSNRQSAVRPAAALQTFWMVVEANGTSGVLPGNRYSVGRY